MTRPLDLIYFSPVMVFSNISVLTAANRLHKTIHYEKIIHGF
ncbi:MAG: hypothetical protein ACOYM0_01040 [Bacteroidales bacterium]